MKTKSQRRTYPDHIKRQLVEQYENANETVRRKMREEHDLLTSDITRFKSQLRHKEEKLYPRSSKPVINIPSSGSRVNSEDRDQLIGELYILIAEKDLMIHRLRAELSKHRPLKEIQKEYGVVF